MKLRGKTALDKRTFWGSRKFVAVIATVQWSATSPPHSCRQGRRAQPRSLRIFLHTRPASVGSYWWLWLEQEEMRCGSRAVASKSDAKFGGRATSEE